MDKLFYLIALTLQMRSILSDNFENLDVKRDIELSTPELIAAYGYPSEVHNVITEDGYILEVHRIANPGKQPVILMHGMLDSSTSSVMIGPKHSLGYILYDRNYDVWILNARGNDYSVGHKKYRRNGTPHERKNYWNFSFHEIGKFDIAATIDYVLKNTGHSKVHYIGHSQGTTSFFVLTSERPEYNDKILLMVAMAPAVFMANLENSLMLILSRYLNLLEVLAGWIGRDEFSKQLNNKLLELQNTSICSLDIIRNTQLCMHNFSPIFGNLTKHVHKSIIPIIDAHAPASAAVKQLFHFGQLIQSHRFCQYNYGPQRNLIMYNRSTPPEYNLKNCTAPVAIIYAEKDTLTSATDVRRLPHELPNVVAIRRVDDAIFNHLDFIWAMDAKELVYNYVLDWLKIAEQRLK